MSAKRENEISSKRLTLFRNGDPNFKPLNYVYSNRTIRNFDKLLEDIDSKVAPTRKPKWGRAGVGTRELWTTDGSKQITSLKEIEELEDSKLVVAGPEGYIPIKNGYSSLLLKNDGSNKSVASTESYRELNKRLYGDWDRDPEDRIHNRVAKAPIKKIYLLRNADPKFRKPKQYVWRQKMIPKLEHLMQEFEKMKELQPIEGGKVQALYSQDGRQITDEEQIEDGGVYIVAGQQDFVHPRRAGSDNEYDDDDERRRSDYGRELTEDHESFHDERGHGRRHSDGGGDRRRDEQYKNNKKPKWRDIDPDKPEADWEELDKKDREFLGKYYEKKRKDESNNPKSGRKIYEKRNQTKPNSLTIFAFRNGHGHEPKSVFFTEQQLKRGFNWLLEHVAQNFGVNPKKLYTLAAEPLSHPDELIHNGAYVLVALGEVYRDTWYYLPDRAIDTSKGGRSMENNNGRSADLRPHTSYYGDQANRYYETGSPRPNYNNKRRTSSAGRKLPPINQSQRYMDPETSQQMNRSRSEILISINVNGEKYGELPLYL